jgi:hypothetical protein
MTSQVMVINMGKLTFIKPTNQPTNQQAHIVWILAASKHCLQLKKKHRAYFSYLWQ